MQRDTSSTEALSGEAVKTSTDLLLRMLAGGVVAIGLLFLVNNFLIFWWGWPGTITLFSHLQWFGLDPLGSPLAGGELGLGWFQLFSYLGSLGAVIAYVLMTRDRALREDARKLSAMVAYIVRAAFWVVLLVGLVDMVISFLRVEGFLESLVGEALAADLGRSQFRGAYVHMPLLLLSLVIAGFVRIPGYYWLALLVVVSEFQIVISRFVFSYEQSFMGDLVRFWYAALFLFASAPALLDEGHVRVDVLYTNFSKRGKAWSNAAGSLLLGLPLCWVILTTGMWGKGNSINSPLLSFEISQSGYGMYIKYLMAGFLVVFAVSMLVQFASYFLSSVADLRSEPGDGVAGETQV
ncbi:MAG: TRAP transporter small permease subunit [Candidatus Tectomicrobia bacterium]